MVTRIIKRYSQIAFVIICLVLSAWDAGSNEPLCLDDTGANYSTQSNAQEAYDRNQDRESRGGGSQKSNHLELLLH
jgi:hypothetical protein